MSRKVPSGTPDRSPDYILPRDRGRPLLWATAAAAVVAVALFALYFGGLRSVTSPGPVSQSHAPIETSCAQCHDVGKGVADLRCERCHDPRGADRFTHPAHVLFGSGSSRSAEAAPIVACATCHTDHRGRKVPVKTVDDRECAQCHKFSSLRSHPEFAAVSAQLESGTGMATFTHDRHVAEVAKQLGKRCEACHVPTADMIAFEPINFDRHCSSCHLKGRAPDGSCASPACSTTETIAAQNLVFDERITGVPAPPKDPKEEGKREYAFSIATHRDPWVLYNAQRLRRIIDPTGIEAEANALEQRVAYLSQQSNGQPLSQINATDLSAWQTTLEQEVASIDSRLAAKTASDDAALAEIRESLQQIGKQLAGADPQVAAAFDAGAANANAARTPETPAQMEQAFTARKAELTALLDAVIARGDKTFSDRATALKKQVEQLKPPAAGGPPDVAALNDRLRRLDDILGAVRATADSQAASTASEVAALRDVVQGRVNGGLSPEEFERRRLELLTALNAIESGGGPAFAGRVAVLRQRVQALQPGSYGDAGLRDLRARKAKQLGRVKLELVLRKTGDQNAPGPAALSAGSDRQAVKAALDSSRARLTALRTGGSPGSAETADEIAEASQALTDLIGPCRKCHATDGARLAPMKPAGVIFQRARFTHKPHVEQGGTCESCHGAVDKSRLATDVNEPGVAKCQECHTPSKSRADCAACHFYHPPSVSRLFGHP
jgi:hypothetical protein